MDLQRNTTVSQPQVSPVRLVEVINFPDPQNVAGTVNVENLPSTQQMAGGGLGQRWLGYDVLGGTFKWLIRDLERVLQYGALTDAFQHRLLRAGGVGAVAYSWLSQARD